MMNAAFGILILVVLSIALAACDNPTAPSKTKVQPVPKFERKD